MLHIDPEGFLRLRQVAGLSVFECGKLLGVGVRTIWNWERGRTAIPYSAFKLLRVLTGGELPGEVWKGFYVRGDRLYSPGREAFTVGELSYLGNVFAMARFWHQDYQRRAAVALSTGRAPAPSQARGARPVGNAANEARYAPPAPLPAVPRRVADFRSLVSYL